MMKCPKCGHLNPEGSSHCTKCKQTLITSPVKKYKENARKTIRYKKFTKTEKAIIAITILVIITTILTSIAPKDLELPQPETTDNNTTPELTEQTTDKIDTTTQVASIGKTDEKTIITLHITDENGDAVTEGTASTTINNIKYSGQVENGNANIILPELTEDTYQALIVYEGTQQYNPSETRATIEINKHNTQITAQKTSDNNILATLKTEDGQKIPEQTIIVTTSNETTTQTTDENGTITINTQNIKTKQEINLTYNGNQDYNPSQNIIDIENPKTNTKLETQVDEELTITLKTQDDEKIPDEELIIKTDNTTITQKTDKNGQVTENLTGNISIKYEGNEQYNPTETKIIIEDETENVTENTTDNSTDNTTENSTLNTTDNSTENTTENTTDNTTKTNVTFKVETINNQTIITLTDPENNNITDQNITIIYDDDTEKTEKTNNKGQIILDAETIKEINKIKLIFEGNNKYNPQNQTITFNT